MTLRRPLIALCLAVATLFACVSAAIAQEPDPGGTPPKPPAEIAAPPPPRPKAEPPASKTAKSSNAEAEPTPPLETDPTVLSALEMPRKEPRDYVQAVLWLIDLERPQLAKPILDELVKLNLTDAQRVALVDEFGSQGMLHLARSADLAPEGAAFADACMQAAAAASSNPQRIAMLVKQLSDPSADARVAARHDLAAAGNSGAIATLEALAQETDPQRRTALLAAVELMHPLVDGPLLAMLDTDDAQLRGEAAALLRHLAVPQASPFIAAAETPADPATAERAVANALVNYKRGMPPFAADAENQIELWKWDDAAKKLSPLRVPADEAQVIWISRLAKELARLRPSNYAEQRQALLLHLESAGLSGAASNAYAGFLAKVETQALNDVLADALKFNYSHAAEAIVAALAARGDASVLVTTSGKPSPLADALTSPNRRVRFAVLQAIMAINPSSPYPGSSRVPDALNWFAGSTGQRQAVVAMPTNAAAGDLNGKLAALQLAAEPTNRARNAVDMARSMPDLEVVFIDMNILAPDIRQALFELRTSPTTGDIPIALMAADGRLEAAQKLAAEHTRVLAVPRPHTPEVVTRIVEDLTKLAARDTVPPKDRAAQAEQAKKWLAQIGGGNRPFYTLRHAALVAPPASLPPVTAPEALPEQ